MEVNSFYSGPQCHSNRSPSGVTQTLEGRAVRRISYRIVILISTTDLAIHWRHSSQHQHQAVLTAVL